MSNYERSYFESIIKDSINVSDVARKLKLSKSYGNRQTIKKYIDLYGLNTDHFYVPKRKVLRSDKIELKYILVVNSTYTNTHTLKNRLYKEGLKNRECELCGQNELWNGMKISLILDHKNGVNNDNRIENLRILCPNCNAGQETFCRGKIKI